MLLPLAALLVVASTQSDPYESTHARFSSQGHVERRDVVANWTGNDSFETFKAPPGQWANLTTHIDVQRYTFNGRMVITHRSAVHVFTLYDPLRTMSGLCFKSANK